MTAKATVTITDARVNTQKSARSCPDQYAIGRTPLAKRLDLTPSLLSAVGLKVKNAAKHAKPRL
jgi:hypothetical protein